MRWIARLLGLAALLTLTVGGYGAYRARSLDEPLGPPGTVRVEIRRGASFRQVVNRLEAAGALPDALTFEIYGRYRGVGRRVKAGTYAIDRRWTPRALLDKLAAGTLPAQVRVTIPEGFNRWQIADLLHRVGLVDREELLARVAAEDLEGRLFPDTYWFRTDAGVERVLHTLTARFDAVLSEVLRGHPRAAALGHRGGAQRALITLASLVEKEAKTDRDRGLIARVFRNRLARGMKLQTDPTCVYGPTLYRHRPHPRYCKDPTSQYSTYVIAGLPPTPIANPGRAALEAALRPASGPEAARLLYFVARRDGSGEHEFNQTYAAHQRAVNRYLKGGDSP